MTHRVIRKEFVGEMFLIGNGAANNAPRSFELMYKYILSPSSAFTFPWLSTIAANYNHYKWNGLRFYYDNCAGTHSSGNSVGVIHFAYNSDMQDPVPTDGRKMLSLEGSMSQKVSSDAVFEIAVKNPRESKVKRTRLDKNKEKNSDYDFGYLFIAFEGVPDAAANVNMLLGRLWVEYDVEFSNPQLNSGIMAKGLPWVSYSCPPVNGAQFWGLDGSTPKKSTANMIGGGLDVQLTFSDGTSGTKVTFPHNLTSGTFAITLFAQTSTAPTDVRIAVGWTSAVNCTLGTQVGVPVNGATSGGTTNFGFKGVFTITGPGASFILPTLANAANAVWTNVRLDVHAVPSDFWTDVIDATGEGQ